MHTQLTNPPKLFRRIRFRFLVFVFCVLCFLFAFQTLHSTLCVVSTTNIAIERSYLARKFMDSNKNGWRGRGEDGVWKLGMCKVWQIIV